MANSFHCISIPVSDIATNFAHVTTAWLSCRVQPFVHWNLDKSKKNIYIQKKSHYIWIMMENFLITWVPDSNAWFLSECKSWGTSDWRFSPTIQIRWKLYLSLIQFPIIPLPYTFAYITTLLLSRRLQNFAIRLFYYFIEWEQNKMSMKCALCLWKIVSEFDPMTRAA